MVENIRGEHAELEPHLFADAEVLRGREVEVDETWAFQGIYPRVAKSPNWRGRAANRSGRGTPRHDESCGVEPIIDGLTRRSRRIQNHVRPRNVRGRRTEAVGIGRVKTRISW